jgi:hypothetical protein
MTKMKSLPTQDEPEIFRQLVYDWDMLLKTRGAWRK